MMELPLDLIRSDAAAFGAFIFAATAGWVYYGRNLGFSRLALAMLLPGVTALVLAASQGWSNLAPFLQRSFAVLPLQDTSCESHTFSIPTATALAVGIEVAVVCACVAVSVLLGLAKKTKQKDDDSSAGAVHEHNRIPIMGYVRAAGEELGWRCFMLPKLVEYTMIHSVVNGQPLGARGYFWVLLISGIAWSAFHLPVLVLLAGKTGHPRPTTTIIVQLLNLVVAAFPIGWIAIRSNYSLWPTATMHFAWNRINPYLLGSVYTNTPGMYSGEQMIINGEGIAGILVMLPLSFWMVFTDLASRPELAACAPLLAHGLNTRVL